MPKDEFEKEVAPEDQVFWLQDFQFNHKKVPFPTILLVGKRFSGKSYTGVSVASKFDVPRWAAWCGTKDTEDFWAEKFESNATVKGPDEEGKTYLLKIIRYQQRKVRLYKKVLKQPFPKQFTIGLIFDDVTSKRQFRKGEILEDLFSNGRHYNAVILISAQYLKQLPPAVRLNTDYMFMMHNTKRTIKVLYEDYVEEPDEFTMFLDLIRYVTGQKDDQGKDMYNALVYDNVKKTSKLDEIFTVYRNENEKYLDSVKLGDKEWREWNKDHFKDKDYELQKREYRKQQRIIRLQQYRQNQMERRINPMDRLANPDLDYFSDSDSEGEEEQDSLTLEPRRGATTKIHIGKGKRINFTEVWTERQTGTNTNTGYSIPPNTTIPPVSQDRQHAVASQPQSQPTLLSQTVKQSHQAYPYSYGQQQQQYQYYGQQPQQSQQQQYQPYQPYQPRQLIQSHGQPTYPSYGQQQQQPLYSQSTYQASYGQSIARQQPEKLPTTTWSAQQEFIRNNSRFVPATSLFL